eukprot:CAMPEP_0175976820 /NCGR_PEP_ID=MMETSP0108-20121206/44732_1 /TAXON_ID=195067 ORGANISM="Goniomonas pacifica, Strain CCMP1869" /NCGR_SAMPLE_ID=MMETSP0108 /ASSEMBLY_ACC=CAM_ASM_000204 /LENGTH=214 /DNA_ID=CAMNT_0017306761 /DNA_START=17 /DNA_END=661 /DNA_ORIENTATION=-
MASAEENTPTTEEVEAAGDETPTEEDVVTEVPPDEHPLTFGYCFWFMRRTPGSRTQDNYEKNIRKIGSFFSAEQFWSYYNHLVRPNDLPVPSDYHLFKYGIKPMWEDDCNKLGGKWIVRLRKGLASRYWEELILGIAGGQFDMDGVCGAVVSIRYQEDIISMWNSDARDREKNVRLRDTIKRVLSLPPSTILEYKAHNTAMKDNSSFRNTDRYQ